MTERHFAFFRQGTGEYLREWKGPVPEPDIDPALVGDARLAALNAWTTEVSQPQSGEVGIDVTSFNYLVGDFCWMVFRQPEMLLDWPITHKFIQIERAELIVFANSESPRPVRSTADTIVVDITGTPLEAFYGQIFGRLTRRDDQWVLEPTRDETIVPAAAQRAIEAARVDVDLVTDSARVLVRR